MRIPPSLSGSFLFILLCFGFFLGFWEAAHLLLGSAGAWVLFWVCGLAAAGGTILIWREGRPRPEFSVYTPPPESPEAAVARAVLSRAPGPSPWYLVKPGRTPGIVGQAGPYNWEESPNDGARAGRSLLRTPHGAIVALCDFHCYVLAQTGGRFLVWASEQRGEGPALEGWMRLQVYDADALKAIGSIDAAYSAVGPARRFFTATAPSGEVLIPTSLADGEHAVDLPTALRGHGELLILTDSTWEGRRTNHFDSVHLRLWLLDTGTGTLRIIPQEWFNSGAYDFGYQWVTRVARDPADGRVYGEGIRLGLFRLDASLTNVESWLAQDLFFHPER